MNARRGLPVSLARLAWVLGFGAILTALAWTKYANYLYDDIDHAIFVQALERALHGSTFLSIRGMSWPGDHASYALWLLAPLYALARHPFTPLLIQGCVLALGLIPVHRMAVRALDGSASAASATASAHAPRAAWGLVAAYLLQPALGYLGLYEFHPEFLATTALLFMFDALGEGRIRSCLAWAMLALLAREDVALVVGGAGVWAMLFRPRTAKAAGGAMLAMALGLLAFTLLVVRPHFTSDAAQYGTMYQALGDSPAAILRNALHDPMHVLRLLVGTPGNALDTQLKHEMLLHLLLPLAFLPLLAPAALLVVLPVWAEHMLSARPQQHTIVYHYGALLLPVLVWAAMEGVRRVRLLGARWGSAAAWSVLACAVTGQVLWSPLGGFGWWQTRHAVEDVRPSVLQQREAAVRDTMIGAVSARPGVIAGFEFLSRLAARDDVHSLHHLLGGTYTYSSAPYPVPAVVNTVVADWSDPRLRAYALTPDAGRRVRRILDANALHPAMAHGDLVEFLPVGQGLPLVARDPSQPDSGRMTTYDDALEYLAGIPRGTYRPSDIDTRLHHHLDRFGTVSFETHWRRVAPLDAVYWMRLELVGPNEQVVATHTRVLGYMVWPVADWPLGELVTERYEWDPGVSLPSGRYHVQMRLARAGAKEPVHLRRGAVEPFTVAEFDVFGSGD